MKKDNLGDRMKCYESVSKNRLINKIPVIIRLDGKAFHTFTRGFDKPFDEIIERAMRQTTLELCKKIQGCVLGYTQSDEITLVLCDYQKTETAAWYDYEVQKMTSVSASIATLAFDRALNDIWLEMYESNDITMRDSMELINKKRGMGAFFDSRAFNVPENEVVNCLIWRQQDATRNSIQALAQSLYSHKELQGVGCNKLQDKMFTEKGVNWNNLTTYQKRGAAVIKVPQTIEKNGEQIIRNAWIVDNEMPIISKCREYVNSRIIF